VVTVFFVGMAINHQRSTVAPCGEALSGKLTGSLFV
jgi:hypothetical protein